MSIEKNSEASPPVLPRRRIDGRTSRPIRKINISNLRGVEEVSAKTGVSPERLAELCEAGIAPHYRIDDGPPLFHYGEIREWIGENLVTRWEGQVVPWNVEVVRIQSAWEHSDARPPTSISMIQSLAVPTYATARIPGVYFLCKGDAVVYVGQSVNVMGRVGTHSAEKDFDRAYYVPVPPSMLDQVEGAFIRALRPELNRNDGPGWGRTDERVIAQFRIAPPVSVGDGS